MKSLLRPEEMEGPTPPDFTLGQAEKDDLEYFQKQLFRGLRIPEGYEKGEGPYLEIDGKIVAQASPGGTLKIEGNKVTTEKPKGE